MVMDYRWCTDDGAERLLRRKGVTWDYATGVAIGLIDRVRSLQNQARIGVALYQDRVELYALHMLDGVEFPALVAFMLPNGTYILAGGNHRLAAAYEAGIEAVDLYVVRTNDAAMRFVITTTLNNEHGLPPPTEDVIEQAISYMETYGHTQHEAAAEYGLKRSAISLVVQTRAARTRLMKAGVNPDRIGKSAAALIGRLPNHNVLRAVAELQIMHGLPDRMLKDALDEVRACGTEGDQLAVVERWKGRDDLKLAAGAKARGIQPRHNTNRSELFRVLTTAANLVAANWSRGLLGLANDDDYQKALSIVRDLAVKIGAMA